MTEAPPAAEHRTRTRLRRLAREPLVHFLLVGGAVFLLAERLGQRPQQRIVVTSGEIDRLIDTFARTWQRPPTPAELRGLVENEVKDEIYYREAQRLGLDRDDQVIRRRLRMKMEFWNENAAEAREPTEQELAAFLAAHPEKFRQPERVSFRQVYVSPSRRGNRTKADAARLLKQLRRGTDPAAMGDPLPLPDSLESTPPDEVGRLFGEAFAASLAELPVGAWEGPVESGYGLHLVRIEARTPATAPSLASLRDAVVREWFAARREEANRALYEKLRTRYTVIVEPGSLPAARRPRRHKAGRRARRERFGRLDASASKNGLTRVPLSVRRRLRPEDRRPGSLEWGSRHGRDQVL
ncbi:MAG: peptidyl-prolyl cis-trans isomerase [Thermoanaerobaculia bacterium]